MYKKKKYTARRNKPYTLPNPYYSRVNLKTTNAKSTSGFYGRSLLMGKEIKTYDRSNVNLGAPGVYNNPVILAMNLPTEVVLNDMAQGSGFNQRIGNKVMIKSVEIKAFISATINYSGVVRLVLAWDSQANSLGPSWNNMMDLQQAATLCSVDPSFFERYRVIVDKTQVMEFDEENNTCYFHEYRKINKNALYTGAGGGLGNYANIATGSITAFFISDVAAVGAIGVGYFSRIRYVDM